MSDTLERPALYYPYIHVRGENWLKATLLDVPVLKRIVPETYLVTQHEPELEVPGNAFGTRERTVGKVK